MPDYDERSDFRAEREWNQHVKGPNNYPVSATYDVSVCKSDRNLCLKAYTAQLKKKIKDEV